LGGSNYGKYDTNEVTVKKGVPVRLHFSADSDAGCGRLLVIYGLGVRLVTKPGEEAVTEFTPDKTGEFQYSCGMRMFGPGVFKVVD
jgi:plastocyanin domain-containing protein